MRIMLLSLDIPSALISSLSNLLIKSFYRQNLSLSEDSNQKKCNFNQTNFLHNTNLRRVQELKSQNLAKACYESGATALTFEELLR